MFSFARHTAFFVFLFLCAFFCSDEKGKMETHPTKKTPMQLFVFFESLIFCDEHIGYCLFQRGEQMRWITFFTIVLLLFVTILLLTIQCMSDLKTWTRLITLYHHITHSEWLNCIHSGYSSAVVVFARMNCQIQSALDVNPTQWMTQGIDRLQSMKDYLRTGIRLVPTDAWIGISLVLIGFYLWLIYRLALRILRVAANSCAENANPDHLTHAHSEEWYSVHHASPSPSILLLPPSPNEALHRKELYNSSDHDTASDADLTAPTNSPIASDPDDTTPPTETNLVHVPSPFPPSPHRSPSRLRIHRQLFGTTESTASTTSTPSTSSVSSTESEPVSVSSRGRVRKATQLFEVPIPRRTNSKKVH
jgi:hypothetical protein